jgi:Na+/phosphate symporter
MVQRAIVTGRISNSELGDEIQKQLIALSRKLIEEQMVAPDESSNSLNEIFNQIDSLINQANDLMFSQ